MRAGAQFRESTKAGGLMRPDGVCSARRFEARLAILKVHRDAAAASEIFLGMNAQHANDKQDKQSGQVKPQDLPLTEKNWGRAHP